MKLFSLAVSAILACAAASSKAYPTDAKQRIIRDAEGRHVIYHGVNVVYKVAPYIPDEDKFDSQTSLNDKDIQDLKNWGFNLVRLGVMWEAVETAPGVYNETYLKEVDSLITKMGEQGIYTLVDAHQDVMARVICGEGMPNFYAKEIIAKGTYCIGEWADYFLAPLYKKTGFCKSMDDYNFRKDKDGNPMIEDCQTINFATYYTSPESWTVFRSLWTNKYGLQDKYVAYWDKMSSILAKNKYVIGFDPTNEPLPSWTSAANALWTIMPESGNFDYYDLQPMYTRIYEAYAKYNNNSYMWFEPGQIPDEIGISTSLNFVFNLGFSKPPGGEIGSKNHVLNDHTYCCQILGPCDKNGEPDASSAEACKKWHDYRLAQRNKDAAKLGIPLAISEFGACMDTDDCVREITQVTEACDANLASWAYWEFKTYKDLTTSAGNRSEGFYNFDGKLQQKKVRSLSRTYIQKAQGMIKEMKFDMESGNFSAIVHVNQAIVGSTDIYVHSKDEHIYTTYYPNGYDMSFKNQEENGPDPDIEMFKNTGDNYIRFLVKNKEFNGQYLKVEISPKKVPSPTHEEFIQ